MDLTLPSSLGESCNNLQFLVPQPNPGPIMVQVRVEIRKQNSVGEQEKFEEKYCNKCETALFNPFWSGGLET